MWLYFFCLKISGEYELDRELVNSKINLILQSYIGHHTTTITHASMEDTRRQIENPLLSVTLSSFYHVS
jgi:hypothetical protein